MSERTVRRYLAALYGDAPAASLIELRYRVGDGMRQSFHRADALDAVTREIDRRGRAADVYVGVLPRLHRAGGRDDLVPEGAVLWVDCDDPGAVAAMGRFSPAPSLLLTSGTRDNRHAYWLLSEPCSLDEIENANRRLAAAVGADAGCAEPARILRPPSLNHKHRPPTAVRLERCDPAARSALADVVGDLPAVAVPARLRTPRISDDPLLRVPPRLYVEGLSGAEVSRAGKARCPFHGDGAASLHVYREPARGWYCYGCRCGGSIYDFAALLWGLSTRGDDFVELADALCSVFGPEDMAS
ncbi:MAG: RepB DNA-primase from phage plasmid [Microbacteriaceae bacterium]|jgi:hypothetical protein|nr:RepB DNA-primase from phage plasmid [Microbacteriaceae bacterium]